MAVLTSNYPTSLDTTGTLGEVSNRAKTTLSVALADTGETQISLSDASAFPTTGAVTIDNEIFYYSNKSGNVLTIESRAQQGTVAATHSSSATVYLRFTKGHWEVFKTSVINLETKLGTGSSTPTTSTWLKGTGTGTSAWSAITKTDVGLSAVENTALSTWAGTSSITTVGTIGTGTWQGTIIGSTYGGTGVNNAGRTLTINTNSGTITFTNAATTLTVANTGSISGTNTGDQTITLTGDVTGSGTGSFATAIGSNKVTLGMLATLAANSVIGNSTGSTATPTAVSMLATATASAVLLRDANANAVSNNFLSTYATTATAAGTTTLTVSSAYWQFFTGATTQTVQLPVATTLANGQSWVIENNSTGAVTVQTSGAVSLVVLAAGTRALITCVNTAGGTGTASWDFIYYGALVTSAKKLSVSNTMSFSAADDTGVYTFPTGTKTLVATDVATLSSLTSVGTIGTGTWQATVVGSTYGGTGVNNAGRTLTINTNSGTLTFTNAATTLTIANTGSISGTNTGDQTITLTSDVTGSGTGSFATTIAASAVTLGKMANLTANSVIGNSTGSSATPTAVSMVTTATASSVLFRDSNANAIANNFLPNYTTTATAAGTTTITVSSAYYQFFTGATTQTLQLPVATTLANGQSWFVENKSTGAVTIQTSGLNTLLILAAGTSALVTCINTAGGTGTASWETTYFGDITVSGKKLSISNTLTLAGTDGTTMTFPSTSATIARTDAANTFTGVQTFSTPIAATSVATMTSTVGGGVPTPPNNTTTFLRGDGTFAAVGGGTVTATGGALTANSVVLGAGTTDTKVVTGITTNGVAQLVLGVNVTTLGTVKMFGNTSGDVTLQPTAVAGTATVQTLPATTGTLVNRVTTANGVSASNSDGALTVSLGDITPTQVTITKTTEQLRVRYDVSNYYTATVGSTGGVTFDAVGAGAKFTFSDNIVVSYNGLGLEVQASTADYQLRLGNGAGSAAYTYDIGRNASSTGFLTFYGNQTTYVGYVFSGVDGEHFRSIAGAFGIGTGATVSARLHVISTTEQLRVGYSSGQYWKSVTDGSANTVFTAVGTGATFQFASATQFNSGSGSSWFPYTDGNIYISSANVIFRNASNTEVGRLDSSGLNLRLKARVTSTTSSSTPTPNCDNEDLYILTALAVGATFGAVGGTPTAGQRLLIRIKDNGTARTLAWNAVYRAMGVALPTTTVISKILYVGFIYNSTDSKWDCVSVAQEA